jgi:ligand-binding sensor domain-containing protein/serine phosphatase RsbU (regulator of sigma subunit)
MKRSLLRLVLWTSLFPFLSAAQQSNFITYSVENGLSQSTVFSIAQDKRGYLWLGTDGGGASRFDGISFRNFDKRKGLSGNIVRNILEDSRGNLWFATNEGVTVYNGTVFKTLDKSKGLSGSKFLKIFEDSRHNIWVATDDGGVNRLTLSGDSVSVKVYNSEYGLRSDFVFDIYEDSRHRIWLATLYGGISILSFDKGEVSVKNLRSPEIPSDLITCIEPDRAGNLWVGTYDAGVFGISLEKAESSLFHNFTTSNGLADNTVWDIMSDREGNMWLATNAGGVARISRNSFGSSAVRSFTDRNGLINNQVLSLLQDKEGNIWLGTGNGLCKFPGDKFLSYTEKDGLPQSLIFSITEDAKNNLLLATNGSGLVQMSLSQANPSFRIYTDKDGLPDNSVKSLSRAPDGSVWVATSLGISRFRGGSFVNYTEDNGLINNNVNCVYVDHRGIVWCGTSYGGSRFDGKRFFNFTSDMGLIDNDIQAITEDKYGNIWFGTMGGLARYHNNRMVTYDEVEGLAFKEIYCLAEDAIGNIWIGTRGGGLYRYNAGSREKKCINLVAKEGVLSSDIIYSLCFINPGTLIVGTNKGFDKLTLNDSFDVIRSEAYNHSDGFAGVENNQNGIYKDSKGNIWFGTVKGLIKYTPALDKDTDNKPRVHITALKLFFEDVNWAEKADSVTPWFNLPGRLSLKHSSNHLTFNFAGLSFINPGRVQYRYMLEGWDEGWSPARKTTEATYSSLSPGEYTFKVVAIDRFGNVSSPESFSFIIRPPWYRTIWFYILCLVSVIIAFYTFVRFRERKLIAEKKMLEEKVEERTREVVRQKEVIEEKNKDITDSINYAKRIQTAILPADNLIYSELSQCFVLFKPKDIVSGDFYFFSKTNGAEDPLCVVAAVDCTGHGVPGAFMSMIGNSLLNQIIKEKKITRPSDILNHLNEGVREALKQKEADAQTRDGMDIALCTIDLKKREIQYAGANRPLYLVRSNNLEEIKADKFPIGGIQPEEKREFTNHVFSLDPGDSIYLSTDGYADQFGGEEGKKFMTKRFKSLLLEQQAVSISKVKAVLEETIEKWKGTHEQVDDICVIGIRI